jgi:hypothetical protein
MSASELEAILARAARLSPDELAQLIKRANELSKKNESSAARPPSYRALFSSGRGAFATPQEADEFVRQERDAWEE